MAGNISGTLKLGHTTGRNFWNIRDTLRHPLAATENFGAVTRIGVLKDSNINYKGNVCVNYLKKALSKKGDCQRHWI